MWPMWPSLQAELELLMEVVMPGEILFIFCYNLSLLVEVVERPGEISFVHGMHHFTHSVHPISAFIYCINSLWFIKSISIFKSRWIYKIHPYLQIQVGNSRHWLSAEGEKSPKIALYQRLQACNCCCSIFDVVALYQRLKACNYISPFLRFLPSMPVLYMYIVQYIMRTCYKSHPWSLKQYHLTSVHHCIALSQVWTMITNICGTYMRLFQKF